MLVGVEVVAGVSADLVVLFVGVVVKLLEGVGKAAP